MMNKSEWEYQFNYISFMIVYTNSEKNKQTKNIINKKSSVKIAKGTVEIKDKILVNLLQQHPPVDHMGAVYTAI